MSLKTTFKKIYKPVKARLNNLRFFLVRFTLTLKLTLFIIKTADSNFSEKSIFKPLYLRNASFDFKMIHIHVIQTI